MNQDVVFVGGGNTKSMLAIWNEWGLSDLLNDAYSNGVIMSGVSAGAICWFTEGITDSWASNLNVMDCMGFVSGCCCPHYDGEANRRPSVEKFLKSKEIDSCLCIEDGAALHYENESIKTAVSFYNDKNAYLVQCKENQLVENPINRIEIN